MNNTAIPVVILFRMVAGPALPKSAWLPPPPRDAPIVAPFPVWSRTIKIKRMQAVICIANMKVVINYFFIILINFSASRLAPPTRAPSTSLRDISSDTFSGLTEPPYRILIEFASSFPNVFSIKVLM